MLVVYCNGVVNVVWMPGKDQTALAGLGRANIPKGAEGLRL